MRFAFSTLGVPGVSVGEVVGMAVESGYQGVELRVAEEEAVHTGIGGRERGRVVEEFGRAGVEVVAVCGYVGIAAEGEDGRVLGEIAELVGLARDLGARRVRVFPGGQGQKPRTADARAVRRLAAAGRIAAGAGVRILVETHDSHPTGAAVSRVLGPVDRRHTGAIWDVLHPWLNGESPAATRAALAPFLDYVQVKDVASREDLTPLPLGAGTVPLAECLAALPPGTWVSWEYEKRWHPAAAELPELLAPGRRRLERLLAAGC
ncbi:sugar phosphate isomerase/epimerase [Streptomyces amakusaensis]